MKIANRDLLFILLLGIVLVFLYLGAVKKPGRTVPDNQEHHRFFQQLAEGGQRLELEHGCVVCHEQSALPPAHPPKEECMVCHRRPEIGPYKDR